MKLSEIKLREKNPRVIKDTKFKKLVKSLKEFPEMLELRPIIIDDNNVILGGNMRYRALKELGYTEISDNWIIKADSLTEEQQKRFLITDNIGFGEWDYDILANEFEEMDLLDFGFEEFELGMTDYSENNKEIDIDELSKKMVIKLEYVDEEYIKVKNGLSQIAKTPEEAVFKLLGLINE